MKEIKKTASFTSKQKGKDVKFNIDLNYSPEYDSFIIKVKEGEGFMAYSSNIERMPLEVIQKLNEMLEEVLIKAGSKTEMMEDLEVELGAESNPNHSSRSHEGSVKIKTQKVKVKSLTEAQNKVREFIEKNDLGAGNFTGGDLFSHGKKIGRVSYNGRVWNLKDEPMKMADGGDFQSGVYANGGYFDGTIPEVSSYMTTYNRGGAMKNERLHVNKDEDYEVRYSKPRPHRKGYKGLRNFEGGGGIGNYYIVTFGFNGDEGYQVVNSKPIFAKSENEAELMLKDQFESYEGQSCDIISTKKQLEGGGEMDLTDDKRLRVRKPVMPKRKMSEQEWAEKHNPRAYEYMTKRKMATGGGVGLIGNQKRIDMNKNGKIDAEDFKLLRSSMNGAWRNERKHVNHNEDYEVRYAKPRPKRTGYKGKRNFEGGGGISKFKMLSDKVARNYEGKRVKPQYQKEYGKVYSKSEAKEVGDKVAGKVKANQKMATGGETKKGGKGGIMVLAKQIRKEGESWQDALKRAGQQLK